MFSLSLWIYFFSNYDLAKDVFLVGGEIYIQKPQTSVNVGASTSASSSSEYRPGIDTAQVLLMGKCDSCAW